MAPRTILLIEDDLHLRRFVAANLAVEGYRVLQAGAEDVARARALGAGDYLVKPLDAAELVRRVRRLVDGREEERHAP